MNKKLFFAYILFQSYCNFGSAMELALLEKKHILARKFIQSFMYKPVQKIKHEFESAEENVQLLVWDYLKNNGSKTGTNEGPLFLSTIIALPIEIFYNIMANDTKENMSISMAKKLSINTLLLRIKNIKEVNTMYGSDNVLKLRLEGINTDIKIPKQMALDAGLTKKQVDYLNFLGASCHKKELEVLASVDDSIIKLIVDTHKQSSRYDCAVYFAYQETFNRMIYTIFKNALINTLFYGILLLTYRHYIVNPLLASLQKIQDPGALETYNQINMLKNEINTLKSQLSSMNVAFKDEYFVNPILPNVPFKYLVSDYPKIFLSILPTGLPAPLLEIIRSYYHKTTTPPLPVHSFFWFCNLLWYGLVSSIPWTPDDPRACCKVIFGFFVFFTLFQKVLNLIIYFDSSHTRGEIDVSKVKSLKKFLTDLLNDDGITIKTS